MQVAEGERKLEALRAYRSALAPYLFKLDKRESQDVKHRLDRLFRDGPMVIRVEGDR